MSQNPGLNPAPPVSRFTVPNLRALPPDIQEMIRAVQEKSGFVPNIFLALAHRPAEFRAFFAYHDALMEKDEGLSKAEREMIVVATSGLNRCQYCVVAHGAILRIRANDPLIADQLAINWRKANLSDRHWALSPADPGKFRLTVSPPPPRSPRPPWRPRFGPSPA